MGKSLIYNNEWNKNYALEDSPLKSARIESSLRGECIYGSSLCRLITAWFEERRGKGVKLHTWLRTASICMAKGEKYLYCRFRNCEAWDPFYEVIIELAEYFDVSELFLIAYFAGDEKLMEASKNMKFSGRPLKKEDFINYSDGIFCLIRSYRSTIGKIDPSCPLYSYLKVRCKETPIYNNKDVTKGMKIHLSTLCISAAKFGEPLSDYYLKVLHYRDTGELPFAIVDVEDE